MPEASEPREIRPFMLFGARPPMSTATMGTIVKDFRAMPVPSGDALPPRLDEVAKPDPKSQTLPVTESVTPSVTGSDETGTETPPTPAPSGSEANPAPAGPLPPSLQRPPLTPGANGQPAPGSTEGPAAVG